MTRPRGGWMSLLLLGGALAQAQQPTTEGDPLPIAVSAKPTAVFVGSPVTLSGNSIATPASSTIKLQVRPPSTGAPPAQLLASINGSGEFSASYTPNTIGTYQVIATAVDGRGQAQTTFNVQSAAAVDATLIDAMPGAVADVPTLLQPIRERLQSLPANPIKDEILQKMDALGQPLQDLKAKTGQLSSSLQQFLKLTAQLQLDPPLQGERDQLLQALDDGARELASAKDELASVAHWHTDCDDLEAAGEGVKFAGALLNIASGNVSSIILSFAQDYVAAAAADRVKTNGGGSAEQFKENELIQTSTLLGKELGKEASGVKLSTSGVVGRLNDVAGLLVSNAMSKYCVEFGGPVKAHMQANFFKNGVEWWQYSFDLIAKLTLHYPRAAEGDSIPVTGRLEGYGTNFKASENALTVLYPNLFSGAVQKHILIPPVSMPATADGSLPFQFSTEGSIFGTRVTPNSFFFQATGVISKNRLIFKVGEVRVDQSPEERVVVLFLSPLTLSYAGVLGYQLPYKDAHFVFERAADNTYDIPLTTQGDVIRGRQQFDKRRDSADAKGHYTVDVTVCNPEC